MSNIALLHAIDEYIGGATILHTRACEVRVSILKTDAALFGTRVKPTVSILVVFYTNELNYVEIAKAAYDWIEQTSEKKIHAMQADWFILSEQGGIYLYEEIGTRENASYRKMRNRFVVINSDTGTVSFGPGHEKNRQGSEKMQGILEAQRSMPGEVWIQELSRVFDFCRQTLAK